MDYILQANCFIRNRLLISKRDGDVVRVGRLQIGGAEGVRSGAGLDRYAVIGVHGAVFRAGGVPSQMFGALGSAYERSCLRD